jgi:hypothetical protein
LFGEYDAVMVSKLPASSTDLESLMKAKKSIATYELQRAEVALDRVVDSFNSSPRQSY